MSLAKKTTVGVIWNFAEMMSKRGISVIITLLLARFLTPDDYGFIAMMSVFTAVATELMESVQAGNHTQGKCTAGRLQHCFLQ
ncbi:MAG: oligosaccharide flippase family protein [Methanolobus sp.]